MKKHLLLIFFAFLIVNAEAFSVNESADHSQNTRTLDVLACTPPTATYQVVPDCENGDQFKIEVNVSSLGSASSVKISDNAGSGVQTLDQPGTVTFGPFPNQFNVTITVADADDDTCKTQSNSLTQLYCGGEPITVDATTYTVNELVTDVLINNACANITNITSSTGTDFSDGTPGIGYFEAGPNSGFPISSGIILSSGNVNNAPGPTATYSDGGSSWPGDSDIDALNQSQGSTGNSYNASIIEFDFVPYTDHISFDFLLASHEYGTFQCSYADTFAFLLTDTQTDVVSNLAVVPGTTTPVSVTTVRDNAYNSGCSSVNPEYFDKYYGSPNGLPEEADPVSFRGYTKKMTAESDVVPGRTYHIKLVIADYLDTNWDSAVFLEAGSFNIGAIDLGPDLTIENQNAPCEESSAILDSGLPDNDVVDISWYYTGDADVDLSDETGPTLEVTESGTYTVVAIYGGSCIISDEIYVEFAPVPEFEFDESDDSLCGTDGLTLDGTPANIDEFEGEVSYVWYKDGSVLNGETGATLDVSEPGTYEVEVSTNLGCTGSHTFVISDAGFMIDLGEDEIFCDMDGFILTPSADVDLSDASFEWEGPGVDGATSESVTVHETGTYTVYVTVDDCVGEASVYLQFDEPAIFDLGPDIFTPELEGIVLDATPSNIDPDEAHYEWTYNGEPIPEDGPIVYPADYGYGTYTVTVYGENPDCISTQTIIVTEEEIICNVSLTANNDLNATIGYCEGEDELSSYEITFTAHFESENASGDIEYTWYVNGEEVEGDGNTLTLTYDTDGEYNDEVTVQAGTPNCGESASAETHITMAPFEHPCKITEGISPGNADGVNDNFNLTFLNDRSGIAKLVIYNRYGTKVYEKAQYSDEWYGQDKSGNELPSGTYYYVIKLQNEDPVFGNVVKGWVYVNQKVN